MEKVTPGILKMPGVTFDEKTKNTGKECIRTTFLEYIVIYIYTL